MYENSNYPNSDSSNSRNYQEYYYSTGNSNGYNSYNGYGQSSGYGDSPSPKKKPFAKKALAFVCAGALFGASAGAVFCVPAYLTNKEFKETKAELETLYTNIQNASAKSQAKLSTTAGSNAAQYSQSESGANVAAIAQSCLPSVVSITNKSVTEVRTMFGTYLQDTEGSGSGIIIGENDSELLIVTNYHVVSGSNELSVVFSYDEDSDNPSLVSAKIKGYVADKDLAVIAVPLSEVTADMRQQIKVATIGDSSNLELGQQVIAIGNALGYGQSVTTGIISALNREVDVKDDNGDTISNKLIQTDAAINPGNSGGALLNMNGELIGINSVKVASSNVEGMGYAIPISDVESIIQELMLKETRDVVDEKDQGYLGISGTDVTSDISETYGMPVGVYISSVYDNSPADLAGLAKGNIITKFDGQTVKSMSELKSLLTYYKSGETVELTAMVQGNNGYEERTFSVKLLGKYIFGSDAENLNGSSNNNSSGETNPNQGNPNNGYYYNPFSSLWPTIP